MEDEWVVETMRIINELTPDIKGKPFDPDWFLLRQRFEAKECEVTALTEALEDIAAFAPKHVGFGDVCEVIANKAKAALVRIK